jgi:peptide chain release factor 2
MQLMARIKETTELWLGLQEKTNTLLELVTMAMEEGDYSLEEELVNEANEASNMLAKAELQLTLSGPYDQRSAILSVHSGAGGTESQDWAEMLLRMYLRWAEAEGRKAHLLNTSPGDETGLRSATLEVDGSFAYGYLEGEKGVHRLVRISPFDASHSRHTSFALVEVLPVAEEDSNIVIRPEELRMDFFRAGGPGGQNVNKVSSAVRLTHLPTGTVVSCQTERSQHQNREYATRILMARLLEMQIVEREQELAKIKGGHVSAEWGNQIRSYVLHPYKLVKDHRTNVETSNSEAVLDGGINEFLKAYLISKVGR